MKQSPVLVFITHFTESGDYDQLFGAGESVPSSPFKSPDGGVHVYCGKTHFWDAFSKGNEVAAQAVVEQLKLDFDPADYPRLKVLIHQGKVAMDVQDQWRTVAVRQYSTADIPLYDACICAIVRLARQGSDYTELRMKLLYAKFGGFYPSELRYTLLNLTHQPGWLETDWTPKQEKNPLARKAWAIFERTRATIKNDKTENYKKHINDMSESLKAWEDSLFYES